MALKKIELSRHYVISSKKLKGVLYNVTLERRITNLSKVKVQYERVLGVYRHWRKQSNQLKLRSMNVEFYINIEPWGNEIPEQEVIREFIETIQEDIEIKENWYYRVCTNTEKQNAIQELDDAMCYYYEFDDEWFNTEEELLKANEKLFMNVEAIISLRKDAY